MKKKKILNICMVLTIFLVIACSIMAVGSIKGWFGNHETASDMTVSEKMGISMIERSGVAYELTTGTSIREGDKLYTKTAASLTVKRADSPMIYMGANTGIVLSDLEKNVQIEVLNGEALFDARGMEYTEVTSDDMKMVLGESVTAISKQAGSMMVYVYKGDITFHDGNEELSVASGNVLTVTGDSEKCAVAKMSAASLSDEQIRQLEKCNIDESFCFQLAELEKVQEMREAEILAARQEAIRQKEEEKKANTNSAAIKPAEVKTEISEVSEEGGTSSINNDSYEVISEIDDSYVEDIENDDSADENDTESSSSMSCTIKIVCDTILDNMENLSTGKEGYVPSSGTILSTTSVSFSEGETVFDVLQRVCSSAGIQLEYSYTPIYESYYIEGINHLYEFDCGNESGWMYKVNGWFPNYGCSSYHLEDGDVIVWTYTCNGLGADVGGTMY